MRKHGPWTIKDSVEKYKNKWISVIEHQVLLPNGNDGIFGIVKMKGGASVLPLDKHGDVYLTKEFRFAVGRESIEVVSGGIEEGESPLDTAKRELKEELGVIATDWIPLGEVHPFTSVIDSPATLFLAKDLITDQGTSWDETEKIELLKMPFKKALQMVLDGEIIHSQSCTLILKANEYLRNHK
jgi:ADP-ribose pyrophosphatase